MRRPMAYAERQAEKKRRYDDLSKNNQNQQQQNKRQNTGQAYTACNSDRKSYAGSKPLCSKCNYNHEEVQANGFLSFWALVTAKEVETSSEKKRTEDLLPIVQDFPEVFPEDLRVLSYPTRQVGCVQIGFGLPGAAL
ncbi:hypothetical protein Tco_0243027 [Tanacetum coccineum]